MCLIHKWNYYGKQYKRGQQYRECAKCGKYETLYHLLHMGISLYFYDEIESKPPYEEIKRKEKNNMIFSILFTLGTPPFILSTGFIAPLRFSIQIGIFHIPFMLLLMVIYFLGIIILYEIAWETWKLYSIRADLEEHIETLYPADKERARESQIKAEKILMYRLASGEISKEEYTARMARL